MWAARATHACSLAVLATLGGGPALAAQEPPDTLVGVPADVHGRVLDVESGDPLAAARVSLSMLPRHLEVRPVETDSAGLFTFPTLEAGAYLLRVVRLGYRTLTDTLRLTPESETTVRISMVPQALNLEPLVVTAVRRTPAFMRDFERRRARGVGHFLTRADIEEQRPFVASDLFRTLPGVRVAPGGAMGGPALLMRGRCRPTLYVDGIATPSDLSVDLVLHPDNIEAVEVYSTAATPARFGRSACGVVLVWTRVGQPTTGTGSIWRRLAVVASLLVGGWILTR